MPLFVHVEQGVSSNLSAAEQVRFLAEREELT
jgi:hypothetical protein